MGYYNDSKATNVDSAWYALDSMHAPVVWIAGGTDKGNDYSVLFDLVRQKVKVLICMGVDNRKLIDNFSGICQVVDTHSLKDALAAARWWILIVWMRRWRWLIAGQRRGMWYCFLLVVLVLTCLRITRIGGRCLRRR